MIKNQDRVTIQVKGHIGQSYMLTSSRNHNVSNEADGLGVPTLTLADYLVGMARCFEPTGQQVMILAQEVQICNEICNATKIT